MYVRERNEGSLNESVTEITKDSQEISVTVNKCLSRTVE